MTQAFNSATLNDLAVAAAVVYNNDNINQLSMGSQWTQIPITKIYENDPQLANAMNGAGFSAQAYVNQQTGEVIIADRGTDNLKNIITDIQIGLGTINTAQDVANNFATAALDAAKDFLKNSGSGIPISAVYTTGHSLGGSESQGQAAKLSTTLSDILGTSGGNIPITNVSFDAPGIGSLATSGNNGNYTSYNFSGQGDLVHLAGGKDLFGTSEVSLNIGPPLWATGGLIGISQKHLAA